MSEQDLSRFLHKVNQLQQLVQSLEADARRRDAMAACTNHNEVVASLEAGDLRLRVAGESRRSVPTSTTTCCRRICQRQDANPNAFFFSRISGG